MVVVVPVPVSRKEGIIIYGEREMTVHTYILLTTHYPPVIEDLMIIYIVSSRVMLISVPIDPQRRSTTHQES